MFTRLTIFIAAFIMLPLGSALSGQRTQIASQFKCISQIKPGAPVLSGIHTGKLPTHMLIRRCDDLYFSISFQNGVLRSIPVQKRFIPRFIPRGKALAIPDGRLTLSPKNIREAWLTRPTQRYDHAILGDKVEAGGLAVVLANKRRLELLLDKNSVFEDRMARLVDLDNDGKNEIVVIHSYLNRGAALAVFGVDGQKLIKLAESTPIGRPHRWLNPVAAADFDGDGNVELAWVETPHIGGILSLARLTGKGPKRALKTIARLSGFSNHTIGSRELLQSATFDWNKDGKKDIILPGANRKTIKVVSFSNNQLHLIDEININATIASPFVAVDLDKNGIGEILLLTTNGQLLSFSP